MKRNIEANRKSLNGIEDAITASIATILAAMCHDFVDWRREVISDIMMI